MPAMSPDHLTTAHVCRALLQFSLAVVVWILQGLHQCELSIHSVALRWQGLGHSVGLSRQWIQHMRKRLRRHSRPCALLMGIDEEDLPNLEKILPTHLPDFGGVEGFSHAYFTRWTQPILCRI
jgi:hypothetical protein